MKTHAHEALSTEPNDPLASLYERGGLILGTSLYEPMAGRKKSYKPYEPAPLVMTDDIAKHQAAVLQMHHDLIQHELEDNVSPSVLRYVFHNIKTRMAQRDGTNMANYGRRLFKTPLDYLKAQSGDDHPTEMAAALLLQMQQVCEQGTIDMNYNSFISQILGRGEVELANLTIIGDKRAEYKEPMYQEVSELLGHDVRGTAPYRIEVDGFDREPDGYHENHLGAMRVKLKRHLGYINGTAEVKQRTFAIIDMSQKSGIDQSIVQAIFAAHEVEQAAKKKSALARAGMKLTAGYDEAVLLGMLRGENHPDTPANDASNYATLPEVDRMLQALIERDMSDPLVLACNETIYSVDKSVIEQQRRSGLLPS